MNNAEWKYNNLSTINNNLDIIAIGKRAMLKKLDWITKGKWDIIDRNVCNNLCVEQSKIEDSNIPVIKITHEIKNTNINKLSNDLFNFNTKTRKLIDKNIIHHQVLEVIDDSTILTHSKYKAPMGVTNRDFLTIRNKRITNKGLHIISIESVNNKKYPFNSEYVRGVISSLVILEPIENTNSVKIITVDNFDPKGWMTKAAIATDSVKQASTEIMNNIIKIYSNNIKLQELQANHF